MKELTNALIGKYFVIADKQYDWYGCAYLISHIGDKSTRLVIIHHSVKDWIDDSITSDTAALIESVKKKDFRVIDTRDEALKISLAMTL